MTILYIQKSRFVTTSRSIGLKRPSATPRSNTSSSILDGLLVDLEVRSSLRIEERHWGRDLGSFACRDCSGANRRTTGIMQQTFCRHSLPSLPHRPRMIATLSAHGPHISHIGPACRRNTGKERSLSIQSLSDIIERRFPVTVFCEHLKRGLHNFIITFLFFHVFSLHAAIRPLNFLTNRSLLIFYTQF
jgi:hypothetical protein